MRLARFVPALLCAPALLTRLLAAQGSTPDSGTGASKPVCFRGQALPRCGGFLVTEFGATRRLNRHPTRSTAAGDDESYFTWEVGGMVNLNRTTALGGSFIYGTLGFDSGDRWGVEARYRRWLGATGTLDAAVGLLLEGSSDGVRNRYPGYTARLAVGSGDLLSLTGGVEIFRFACEPSLECRRRSGTDVAWYGGLKLASYPGVIAGIVAPVLVSFAAASLP